MAVTNPVYDQDFPDPSVIRVDGRYYAYSTQNRLGALPVLTSSDLVSWSPVGDGMPKLPTWVQAGRNWAPEVAQVAPDRFVAYYTAWDKQTQRQCVGRAVADSPAGPFVDESDRPLICQDAEGGSIDASPFTDVDGTGYLLWKNDGNAVGVDTWVYLAPLSDDGLSLLGEPVPLIKQDQAWEGDLVEGPYLWVHDGRYYLFYSGNGYASDRYGVGYAVADAVAGPYVKPFDGPIMATNDVAAGPGHGVVVAHDDHTWYVHHAWPPDAVGSAVPGRQMWLTELTWEPADDGGPDRPVLHGPAVNPSVT